VLTSPDERVLLEARRHGAALLVPLVRSLALALAGAALLALGWPLVVGAPVALGAAAALALGAVWRWDRTRLVVTTDKLVLVQGTVRRRAAAVRLARAGGVEVEQTLAGRLLGYGTLHAGRLEIPYVARPRDVARLVA
jgi:uncharacterized membrane protein YdbT with pleckstrin-like domain